MKSSLKQFSHIDPHTFELKMNALIANDSEHFMNLYCPAMTDVVLLQ